MFFLEVMQDMTPKLHFFLQPEKLLPSRELTYPPKWHFEDDFPFPKVGYVNSLEGNVPHLIEDPLCGTYSSPIHCCL